MHRLHLWIVPILMASAMTVCAETPAPEKAEKASEAVPGTISLHSSTAKVHGTMLRYEPQPNKNTLGFWTKQEDWAEWEFEVPKEGRYEFDILQGCGKGSGGAEVEFAVGGQTFTTKVQDTGHFQNFIRRSLGFVTLPAGKHTLTVKPKSKPGPAVMDLREVRLIPAQEAAK